MRVLRKIVILVAAASGGICISTFSFWLGFGTGVFCFMIASALIDYWYEEK
jgi:hypothetical protein